MKKSFTPVLMTGLISLGIIGLCISLFQKTGAVGEVSPAALFRCPFQVRTRFFSIQIQKMVSRSVCRKSRGRYPSSAVALS